MQSSLLLRFNYLLNVLFLLSFIVFLQPKSKAQELVYNGGAEMEYWNGWTAVTPGDYWIRGTKITPHGGSYFFFPNATTNASSEIFQDIGVSANATSIDAGTAYYMFSGWRSGYPANLDRSQIIVEYRDASGNILSSYNTGSAVFTTWTNTTDNRYAPVGTRSIRIRLISVRVTGTDNDGYYDDISLKTCTAPTSVFVFPSTTTHFCLGTNLVVSGIALPSNSNYYYTWVKDGSSITPISNTFTPYSKPTATASDAGIYTLKVQDGTSNNPVCSNTASVSILIDPIAVAGTISSNQDICGSKKADDLIGSVSTGGTSQKYYKWQHARSLAGPWTTAYNNTTVYSPGFVVFKTYFRRIDSSGACAAVATNTITIQSHNGQTLSPITSLVRDTLCIGENFQLIPPPNDPPFSYPFNGFFYYTWKKVQGSTTIIVSPITSSRVPYPTTPQAATLLDSGTYYFISQDGTDVTTCKDSVKIIIRVNQAPTSKAIIKSNQELCLNDPATPLTEVKPATGIIIGALSYQWYTSKDTTGLPILSKIPSASNISYNPGTPTTTNYYVRKDSVKYCTAVQTNFVKVRVNNRTKLDSIRATVNDTLCVSNLDQFQLKGYIDSLTAGKQSINGGFYFTWKQLQQPATSSVVVSPTAPYMDYPAQSRTVVESDSGTYYLIVQDGINAKKCLDSMLLKIVVFKTCISITCAAPAFVSIKVSPTSSTTLCAGNTLSLEKDVITLPSTPPTFGYMYSWIRTNTLGTVVVQGPTSTYQDLVVNSATAVDSGRYQLIVKDGTTSPAVCSNQSLPISIQIKNAITHASVGRDTIICAGNAVSVFTESISNSGGTGSYSYQWQSSSDNIHFNDISSATNSSYQSPNISNTTYFRRTDHSGTCPTAISDTIIVTTTTGVIAGTIQSTNPTICNNTIPSEVISNIAAPLGGTGGNSSISYQWQRSLNRLNWTNIIGATSATYSETNKLTDTTYYRRKDGMGLGSCDSIYTTPVQINVYGTNNPGVISKDTSICAGNAVKIKESIKTTGTINSYQWISYSTGNSWGNAQGNSTSKEYTTVGLTDTTWYKRIIKTACGNDTSNIIKISVISRPIVSAGVDTTVFKNSIIQLNGSVIGSTNYEWNPYTNLNNPSILKPDAKITSTITYRLKAFDPTGKCSSVGVVRISVKAPLIIPNVITPNGDGVNDTWIIEDIDQYPNASFTIYNRWGNIVWKSTSNAFGWNGTNYRNGEALPQGTYFYILDLKSIAYDEPVTGYIQIIR